MREARVDQRQGATRRAGRRGRGSTAGSCGGDQHPLVDERAVRQARDVEEAPCRGRRTRAPRSRCAGGGRRACARRRGRPRAARARPMNTWRIAGSPARAVGAERGVVGRHRAPAEEADALLGGGPLDDLLAAAAVGGVGGQEDEADAVAAGPGQRDPGLAALVGQEARAASASGCRRRRRCSSRSRRRRGAPGSAAPGPPARRCRGTCGRGRRRRSRCRRSRARGGDRRDPGREDLARVP